MEGGPRESDDGRNLSIQSGVIPRAIKQIFDYIEMTAADSTVKVTFLELYNEELTDLLSYDDDPKRLRLLEDRNGVIVQGLEEMIVRSSVEIYQVLDRGTSKRKTAETLLNKRSSRSHSIFSITIHLKETTAEGEDVVKVGKLNLVDLAGSENISRSGAKDNRAREAGSINQSLLTLGRVITALVEHSGHIPYRDSKLTRLLRDSLGGKTKTCIIATIAPTVQCQEETISTLDYAHRAKNIRNRPEMNQKISKDSMIKEMTSELEKIKCELFATREKNGVYMTLEQHNFNELERMQLRDQLKALRMELDAKEEAFMAAKDTHKAALEEIERAKKEKVDELEEALKRKEGELSATIHRLSDAKTKIQEKQFIIEARSSAEEALATHAHRLADDLSSATKDLSNLFNFTREVQGLRAQDRSAMQHAQTVLKDRLTALKGDMTTVLSSQIEHLKGVSTLVAGLRNLREEEMKALDSAAATAATALTAHHTTASAAIMAAEAAAGKAVGALVARGKELVGEVGSSVEEVRKDIQSLMNSTAGNLRTLSASLSTLCERERSRSESLLTAMDSQATLLSNSLNVLTESHSSLLASNLASSSVLLSAVSDFETDFKAESQVDTDALLQQVSALILNYRGKQITKLGKVATAMKQNVKGNDSKIEKEAEVAQDVLKEGEKQVKLMTETIIKEVEGIEGERKVELDGIVKKMDEEASATNILLEKVQGVLGDIVESKETEDRIKEKSDVTESHVEEKLTTIARFNQDAVSLRNEGEERVSEAAKEAIEAVKTAEGAVVMARQQAKELVHNSVVEVDAKLKEVEASTQEAATALADFSSEHGKALLSSSDALSSTFKVPLATEPQRSAPMKRRWEAAMDADTIQGLRCMGEAALVKKFKKSISSSTMVGGKDGPLMEERKNEIPNQTPSVTLPGQALKAGLSPPLNKGVISSAADGLSSKMDCKGLAAAAEIKNGEETQKSSGFPQGGASSLRKTVNGFEFRNVTNSNHGPSMNETSGAAGKSSGIPNVNSGQSKNHT
eukprot:CAMPEP_0175085176 /NCGR_PEP_ID=MMETSP0052_2-20121109/28508_1 /TAXON_ID=51329 ORGANISM="Polytomella parva, Strain SAG 63-3" /NCGR_SAMPLE_ID=MMETSP0052_2 /ASSEMBLY_ACC=CAM_ASM_000194 /LENGTH=1027 /DNA_ID=CAMNT_0016357139 /DNA_START=466 /DNA_END=3549 /DNA_ORIENTATION=-